MIIEKNGKKYCVCGEKITEDNFNEEHQCCNKCADAINKELEFLDEIVQELDLVAEKLDKALGDYIITR